MAEHTIEYDAECTACKATGLYVGMGEHDGAAIVCSHCNGTGKVHKVIKYRDFEKRKKKRNVKRVYKTNPGIGIGEGHSEKYGKLKLETFGGMPYKDWFAGKPFPAKSEMRKFTCPAWWYQSADYDKKPEWKRCRGPWSAFRDCEHFKNKEECWARFDREK